MNRKPNYQIIKKGESVAILSESGPKWFMVKKQAAYAPTETPGVVEVDFNDGVTELVYVPRLYK